MGDLNVDVNRKFLNDLNKTIIAFDNEKPWPKLCFEWQILRGRKCSRSAKKENSKR